MTMLDGAGQVGCNADQPPTSAPKSLTEPPQGGVSMRIPVRYLRRFHAVATVIWLVLTVPSLLWWSHSLLWIILLSVWANVASHFGAWQGARAEDAAG